MQINCEAEMVHKHDWLTGILCEIECYCTTNKLDRLALEISRAISTAAEEIDAQDSTSKVIHLSVYRDRKIASGAETIILKYGAYIDDALT